MKNFALAGAALAIVLGATPALANPSTGSINVTGTVAPKCYASEKIEGEFRLGDLSKDDGTLNPAKVAGSKDFTVKCTTGTSKISLKANPLGSGLTAVDGYSNTVHYEAKLVAQMAASEARTFTHDSSKPSEAVVAGNSGGFLKNADNNISVSIANSGANSTSNVLQHGNYAGSVEITVTPN